MTFFSVERPLRDDRMTADLRLMQTSLLIGEDTVFLLGGSSASYLPTEDGVL